MHKIPSRESNTTSGRTTLQAGWLFLLSLALTWHHEASADAQLMVSPTRVVFEGNTRTAEVNLINAGDQVGTFRVGFERKQMTQDGAYVDAENGGLFADPFIRFSPRQVTLAPGQSQTVRLLLRKPADLIQGEYRSHLLFQSIPDAATTSIEDQVQENKSGVNVRLIPVLGISIPVIARHGKLSASSGLSQLSYSPPVGQTPATISLLIERSGTKSIYGDLLVKYRHAGQDKEYVVGMAKGVAVFPPNAARKFSVRLQQPAGLSKWDGTFAISYREPDEEGGKLLGSANLTLSAAKK